MQTTNVKTSEQRRLEAMALLARQAGTTASVGQKPLQRKPFRLEFDIRDFSSYPEIRAFNQHKAIIAQAGVENPYFRSNDSTTGRHTLIDGKQLISFSGYNYLGFSGHPKVNERAKNAIDLYGTSPSASRLVTGEKPVHRELENALAGFLGTESALVFASGHATNVTVIGHFFNTEDLILYDELSHNSLVQGCLLSGARRIAFKHNNVEHCEQLIAENQHKYQKILVAVEGAYSMDGDLAPLRDFVRLRQQYQVLLFVDEAHSLGTVGTTGRGISEYAEVSPSDVDFWMGTLSKALASNGGYIAGRQALIDYLKYTTPGFVYSAGITPANAAAALASLELLDQSNQSVLRLQENANYFRKQALGHKLDIGPSADTPIVPVIIGDSEKTIQVADQLFRAGINVHPMFYPSVPQGEARLRFFISSEHTREDMTYTLDTLASAL
ncbi:MAG TPA: aminotransferase class I/II-fold pyridoxal phosphate-dependent enzyme [Cellvibrio sp.]|nr:aminotransferase class I/II-fold pyridoxal phosphate-dependent enzyme [Cellvibrio sp.]